VAETLKDHNKDIKSEPETLSSSFGSLSSEEIKSHYSSFENPLFLGPSFDYSPEEKPLSAKDQDSLSVQLSCHTQGTISPSTSPIFAYSQNSNTKDTNMVVNRMDAIVAARYAPLILPQVMYAFPPNDYMKYFPRFNGEGGVTAEEHLNSFYSFADNFNVEHADVWMRLFVQSLDGEARKWFRSFPPNSIADIEALDDTFLRHWGDKKDFLYYITEFGALKRKQGESIPDFTKRFNKMYGKIPDEIKPSETSAKITFANAFDVEFSLLLRERRSSTLNQMQEAAIEVESNILAADKLKSRGDRDRKKKKEEMPSSSNTTSDSKIDEMDKMLKALTSEMERLKMEQKQPSRPAQEGGYRNQNQFRRPNNAPQILPRERKNQEDQKVLPPFQNNAVDEEEDEDDTEDDPAVHLNDSETSPMHVTQQDYEDTLISNQFEEGDADEIVQKEPKRKKYNLRSNSNAPKVDTPVSTKKANNPVKAGISKDSPGIQIDQPVKQPAKVSTAEIKEPEKNVSSFSLEHEINKIKIFVPLLELMKTDPFRKTVLKALQSPAQVTSSDTINLEDENPAITIGPHIEDITDTSPPFYISLNVHDKILHNCLMDSGASHNVMPKVVMEELGLDITKPYHDLYSFDSKKVKCLGVMKDVVVTLSQLPMKSVVLDVIVADIPPKFGMLLSRSWAKKVGGTLQMDLSYATIPVFGGEQRRLYREVRMDYLVSDHENPTNHPIYVVEDDLGSSIFHMSDQMAEVSVRKTTTVVWDREDNFVWKMYFDGACSREGSGVGIVFISPTKEVIPMSYKLEFDTTNNISEYEALLLGLKAAKDMGIDKLSVFGDSELIIHQIKNIYQTKQQRLKQYRNEVWDYVDNLFLAFNITFVHIKFKSTG
jgi:ribonuclease HI